jgi:two-component system, OmpR family, phosphate regulon response regulator PhoB
MEEPRQQVGRQERENGSCSVLLVVENPVIRSRIVPALRSAGYIVAVASSLARSRAELRQHLPDLVLLDCTQFSRMGLTYLPELRRGTVTRALPIIVLIDESAPLTERVNVLDRGADDCVLNPVVEPELLARVGALLRRAEMRGTLSAGKVLRVGPLELDTASQRVAVNGRVCRLGPTEFELLKLFMQHPERVFSRSQLRALVRGPETLIELRAVDVFIRRLRVALAPYGRARCIETVHRRGYRLTIDKGC